MGLPDWQRYNEADSMVRRQSNQRLGSERRARRQQLGLLDQTMNDPRRQSYYNALYGTALQSGLQNVREQGSNDFRSAGFNAADRGVLGGSSDLERRTDVQRSVNANALGAEQNAYGFMQGVQQNDTDKFTNLRRLIESSNPDSQAAFAQQLQGITQAQQGYLQRGLLEQQGRNINQYNQNAQSQLIGNALGYAGTQYQTDQSARAYGGRGLSYLDWANSGSDQGIRS